MAVGGGAVYIIAPGKNAVREVLWARYVDWLITTRACASPILRSFSSSR